MSWSVLDIEPSLVSSLASLWDYKGELKKSAACGLFAELEHLIATMKESGLCSTAHYKEMYLPQSEIDGK